MQAALRRSGAGLILAGAMAASMVLGGPAYAQEPAPSQPEPVQLQARAFTLDTVSDAWSAWGEIATCVNNAQEAGGWWGCLTAGLSGPGISDVLNRLDEMDRQIAANQAELINRFGSLERAISETNLQGQIRDTMIAADVNSQDAYEAWKAMMRCLQRSSQGAITCRGYRGSLGGEEPILSALDGTRQYFQQVTDILRSRTDLRTLVANYAGAGRGTGLLLTAWTHYKGIQDNDSGVPSNSPWRNSQNVPIITPVLAANMNAVVDYYTAVIGRYHYVMSVAEGMRSPVELRCGSQAESACRANAVRSWIDLGNRWIRNASQAESVAFANARFRMPTLAQNSVMVIMGGQPTVVFNGSGGTNTLTRTGVRDLAMTINGYGRVSNMQARFPAAVPGRYVAKNPIRRGVFTLYSCTFWATCPPPQISYNVTINQPRDPAPGAQTCSAVVSMYDAPREWPRRFNEWLNARPEDAGAREIVAASSAPNYNSGWWLSFREPWNRVYANYPISSPFVEMNVNASRAGEFMVGWGGDIRCVTDAPSTKTPNAPGAPSVLRANP
ncbi:MAG: hypothetical protein KGN78_14570 [Actinomycetales bacterium]|nr:hypothetical protein [Actinomycetales bacterium]